MRTCYSDILFPVFHLAAVSTQKVCAGGAVLAGVGRTFIHLLLTVAARVSSLAVTVVNVSGVQTLAGVLTQLGNVNS